ncbi:hypothetical protein MKW98_017340 [Papaver atlanticum]|uniref:Uncharacterized protein n=1 Tax=Papaver atlanticum TaxID=357466 RepID=A0AAD4XHW2_9MAGN|nr:hypothetical protein MKW98_017340 [Papaver atlanticum]
METWLVNQFALIFGLSSVHVLTFVFFLSRPNYAWSILLIPPPESIPSSTSPSRAATVFQDFLGIDCLDICLHPPQQ